MVPRLQSPPATPFNSASDAFELHPDVASYGTALRAECGCHPPSRASPTPDAALFLADRVVAIDHDTDDMYLLALVSDAASELESLAEGMELHGAANAAATGLCQLAAEEAEAEARVWLSETEARLAALGSSEAAARALDDSCAAAGAGAMLALQIAREKAAKEAAEAAEDGTSIVASSSSAFDPARAGFRLRRNREAYVADVDAAKALIDAGETYEVCLTNELRRGGGGDGDDRPCPDPATLYAVLRRTNPAPYAAYLNFGGCGGDGARGLDDAVVVCCSSPERFLRLTKKRGGRGGGDANDDATVDVSSPDDDDDDGGGGGARALEAKPIKGTAPRRHPLNGEDDVREARELASSVKDRAENLMIVDLLRNDLGRVCVPGSVSVPGLMKIESYATVHQARRSITLVPIRPRWRGERRSLRTFPGVSLRPRLGFFFPRPRRLSTPPDAFRLSPPRGTNGPRQLVSTVVGTRDEAAASPVACARAAFPPGSMTGAPKPRTMEIIDALEPSARGAYSGSIGFFSVNDAFDLNVVIRTAVLKPGSKPGSGEVFIGAGGAITTLSDSSAEWEEAMLKSRAIVRAVEACDELAARGAAP
jgi:para-aminobenzoate synthetase